MSLSKDNSEKELNFESCFAPRKKFFLCESEWDSGYSQLCMTFPWLLSFQSGPSFSWSNIASNKRNLFIFWFLWRIIIFSRPKRLPYNFIAIFKNISFKRISPAFWAPSPQYLPYLQDFPNVKLFIGMKSRELHFSSDIWGSKFKHITPQKNMSCYLTEQMPFNSKLQRFGKNFRKQLYSQKLRLISMFMLYVDLFFS